MKMIEIGKVLEVSDQFRGEICDECDSEDSHTL